MIGDNTNKTKTKKKINGDFPEEVPKIIVTDSINSVESSEVAGALIDSSCEATDTNISTILVETDLFIPFSSVATSSATGMKRAVGREDQINLVDDDIEECAEHSEICEEVCEEDNAEKIDGEQEHGEEEEGGEEEEEVVSGGDDDGGGDGDDNDVEEEDRNDNGEKDEKRMRHNLSIIEELQAANILQYIPKCLFS